MRHLTELGKAQPVAQHVHHNRGHHTPTVEEEQGGIPPKHTRVCKLDGDL